MRTRSFLSGLLSACLILSTLPARAELIGSSSLLNQQAESVHQEKVAAFLAREDVQQQLEVLGVAPEQAAERVASLTTEELQALSRDIDELPAGAGALELVLIIVLLLIVLELLGAINIFTRI